MDVRKLMRKSRNLKSARIIIRNLPFKTSEDKLKELFSQYGNVTEVTLLKKENRPIGCGFVQYETKLSASKAIAKLSGSQFQGRPIILDWALPKNVYEKANKIKKEDPDSDTEVKEEPLESDDDVEQSGELLPPVKKEKRSDSEESYSVDSGSSFSDSSESSDEEDNESLKCEIKEEVKPAIPKRPKSDTGIIQGKTLFIKNIPFSVDSPELEKHFSAYGPMEYALICKDSMTGHSRGSGFIQFKEKQHADECLKNADSLHLKGQKLSVQLALQKNELDNLKPKKVPKDSRNLYLVKEGVILAGSPAATGVSEADMLKRLQLEHNKSRLLKNLQMFVSPTRLVVHNLPPTLTDKGLWRIFKKHSPSGSVIKEAKIMRNMRDIGLNGVTKSKEFGFVSFLKHLDALAALRAVNNNPDIFSDHKRPIVSFSIESRAALQLKEKRLAKSQGKDKAPTSQNSNETTQDNSGMNATETESKHAESSKVKKFHGVPAKFGATKLRTKKELRRQAQLHRTSVKKQKRFNKISRKQKRNVKSQKKAPK